LEWIAAASYKNPDAGLSNGLLTPGDVITDFSAAIRAIGAGRRGAATIHKILYDMDLELPDHTLTRQTTVQNIDHVENITPSARQIMALNNISDIPAHAPELEKGFTEPMAIAEANRCLRCGLICYSDQTAKTPVKIREAS
jgi:formate dehydrogenase beta subunit